MIPKRKLNSKRLARYASPQRKINPDVSCTGTGTKPQLSVSLYDRKSNRRSFPWPLRTAQGVDNYQGQIEKDSKREFLRPVVAWSNYATGKRVELIQELYDLKSMLKMLEGIPRWDKILGDAIKSTNIVYQRVFSRKWWFLHGTEHIESRQKSTNSTGITIWCGGCVRNRNLRAPKWTHLSIQNLWIWLNPLGSDLKMIRFESNLRNIQFRNILSGWKCCKRSQNPKSKGWMRDLKGSLSINWFRIDR